MGVKSLWTLLNPVGRPVMLETVEGKALAIDSSIWIYQFQATMRDKEGRGLVNAHVLGFLRRITKLLFYGIKPVFVFDGGAPVLKRNTINERKKKKSGAAASHTKIAERLLAAQLRREALNHAQAKKKGKPASTSTDAQTDGQNVVYLEDIDPASFGHAQTSSPKKSPQKESPSPAKQKNKDNKFRDYDPYSLPQLDLANAISKASNSALGPDHRFATDEELRSFIDEIHPEDLSNMSSLGLDVTSADFRSLPTDVQYEIIGDLRLKSRQTSYARLEKMLNAAPTPMDFSRQQIKFLKQRNDLTQQLLMTTDNMNSKDGFETRIPIRIASERNKQYVLVKNHGKDGGWILGIKDDGTRDKPIEIDIEPELKNETDEDDMEMEEVSIPQQGPSETYHDPDLREYQRSMTLSSIAGRSKSTSKGLSSINRRPIRRTSPSKNTAKQHVEPLFQPDPDDPVPNPSYPTSENDEDDWVDEYDDAQMEFAIQASLEAERRETVDLTASSPVEGSSRQKPASTSHLRPPVSSSEPSRLETALAFANTSPRKVSLQTNAGNFQPLPKRTFPQVAAVPMEMTMSGDSMSMGESVADADDVSAQEPEQDEGTWMPTGSLAVSSPTKLQAALPLEVEDDEEAWVPQGALEKKSQSVDSVQLPEEDSDVEMDVVGIPAAQVTTSVMRRPSPSVAATAPAAPLTSARASQAIAGPSAIALTEFDDEEEDDLEEVTVPTKHSQTSPAALPPAQSDSANFTEIPWSRSPSPVEALPNVTRNHSLQSQPAAEPDSIDYDDSFDPIPEDVLQSFDAAEEMDPQAEETGFASFLSQVANRDLKDVQKEIDAEILMLNQQRKAAMRDSEDVTQGMVNQIMMMLRLFGIPYITAPMEAEAQCAELVALGLVEGVITDDSDVFLFGTPPTAPISLSDSFTPRKVHPLRVYKNMFNQSKTVEVYHLTDLSRELGLDKGSLVRLAYLLGSDYTEGLPGVGPVLAMELLAEFPGDEGLYRFREWWGKVQMGRDKEDETTSSFRKRFKKKFKNLYLPSDWPNSSVLDAYYHPTVDSSDEPFKWGLPDLDGLRTYLHSELGWNQGRVDELLLPIIKKMGKRTSDNALNRQGTLATYLEGVGPSTGDSAITNGTFAGGSGGTRKKTAFASKRLQKVVNDYKKEQLLAKRKGRAGSSDVAEAEQDQGAAGGQDEVQPPPSKKPRKRAPNAAGGAKKPAARKKRTASTRGKGKQRSNKGAASEDEAEASTRPGSVDSDIASEYEDGSNSKVTRKRTTEKVDDNSQEHADQEGPAQEDPPRPRPRPRRKAAAAAAQQSYRDESE